MTTQTFHLPDVGEGLTEADIVSWRVKPGDTVAINDVLVEIETAKSLVELPSPFAGTVGELLAAEGVTLEVGAPLITIGDGGSDAPVAEEPAAPAAAPAEGGGSVLVGYGTGGDVTSRRRRGAKPAATEAPAPVATPTVPPAPAAGPVPAVSGPVLAKPPVRKLAKDLGVDLSQVPATGSLGQVTRDDVTQFAAHGPQTATPARSAQAGVEVIPVKGVRKVTSAAMVQSAFTAPHVTIWKDVDATRTMEFVKRLKASSDFAGVRVSPLLIVARAVIWAAQRNPMVNAAWVDGADGASIVVPNYVNLGIAAATPRGLIVPNIKNAQDLTLRELASALEQLTLTARDGKTPPADQQGGTITITNIGSLGMDAGTPILNPGETGIIAMGTITEKPWVVDREVRARWVTTVSGSFDHRVVDGEGMSRFIADVASILEEPALLLD